ncbi:hypothetical protein NDU88_002908 [Pleurodeles waltl]|uniref:Uncharacterized protein n=1 Tax=Pleurodeles waltl TaxID=8319 RepID=A0AAV7MQ94_PLEWA|nr:hypothetical protein NDU88_002908 [Pleurodeles waltl]
MAFTWLSRQTMKVVSVKGVLLDEDWGICLWKEMMIIEKQEIEELEKALKDSMALDDAKEILEELNQKVDGNRCSRLSVDPAHDAPEWQLPRGVRGEKDGLPCSLGNGDAGTSLRNPDIRVPDRTKREDGLHLRKVEDAEKAEKTERKETEENTENEERKEDDDGRRNGNSVVPSDAADQRGTERNGDTRAYRHAPGGTWLTKDKVAQHPDGSALCREEEGTAPCLAAVA